MKEIWKTIQEYENYQISNLGRIKSLKRKVNYKNIKKRTIPGKILKLQRTRGYCTVTLSNKNIRKTKRIHRLVAQAFIPNPENKPCINHIDCNKQNNRVENLEWCYQEENEKHAYKNGLKFKGEKHPNSKLKKNDVIKIKKLLKTNMLQTEIAKIFNIGNWTISAIKLNKTWKHVTLD